MLLIWSSVITQISQIYEELRVYFAISFYPPHLEKSWKFLHLLDFHYSREVHSHVRPFSHKLSIFISALVLSTMPVNLLSPCQCLSAPGLLCVFDLLASAPYSFSSPNSCPPNKEPNIANPFPSILTFEQYRFSWNIVIFFLSILHYYLLMNLYSTLSESTRKVSLFWSLNCEKMSYGHHNGYPPPFGPPQVGHIGNTLGLHRYGMQIFGNSLLLHTVFCWCFTCNQWSFLLSLWVSWCRTCSFHLRCSRTPQETE